MVFDGNGMQACHSDAGFVGECHGEGDQRMQSEEFVGVGQVRCL